MMNYFHFKMLITFQNPKSFTVLKKSLTPNANFDGQNKIPKRVIQHEFKHKYLI